MKPSGFAVYLQVLEFSEFHYSKAITGQNFWNKINAAVKFRLHQTEISSIVCRDLGSQCCGEEGGCGA